MNQFITLRSFAVHNQASRLVELPVCEALVKVKDRRLFWTGLEVPGTDVYALVSLKFVSDEKWVHTIKVISDGKGWWPVDSENRLWDNPELSVALTQNEIMLQVLEKRGWDGLTQLGETDRKLVEQAIGVYGEGILGV